MDVAFRRQFQRLDGLVGCHWFGQVLPSSSGGAGLVDQSVENRNFIQNTNNQMYNNQKIDNAKVLEDMKIIESLNKYR